MSINPEIIDPTPDTLRGGALGVQGEGEPTITTPKQDPDPDSEANVDEEGDEPKKKMGGFQKRISKLNARLVDKDEQIAARDQEIARLRAAHVSPEQPTAPKASTKPEPPDEDSFNSYAEYKQAERKYVEDLADWKAKETIRALREEEQQNASKAKEKEAAEEAQKTWANRLEAAHEAHPDLDELLEADLPATPAMMQAIVESEVGGELLYRLAKDPAECRRISQLSPLAAARALGRIEVAIEAETKAKEGERPSEPTPKRTSSAPAPLQPLKGTGSATKDPTKLSDAEWMRAQRKR